MIEASRPGRNAPRLPALATCSTTRARCISRACNWSSMRSNSPRSVASPQATHPAAAGRPLRVRDWRRIDACGTGHTLAGRCRNIAEAGWHANSGRSPGNCSGQATAAWSCSICCGADDHRRGAEGTENARSYGAKLPNSSPRRTLRLCGEFRSPQHEPVAPAVNARGQTACGGGGRRLCTRRDGYVSPARRHRARSIRHLRGGDDAGLRRPPEAGCRRLPSPMAH